MFKYIDNWGDAKCTFNETIRELVINIEGNSVVVDANVDEDGYVITPWNNNRADVKSVIIKGHISFKEGSNLSGLFYRLYSCESIDGLDKLDTSNVTNISHMFDGCNLVSSIDVSKFNTENVTDMSFMFWNCYSLTLLDLSGWNTAKVTDMSYMFWNYHSLTSIITPKEFDISNKFVTELYGLCNNWYDVIGNQLTSKDNIKPKMLYCKNINDIHKSLTELDFSINNRMYYSLDNNVLTIYPIIHPNIGYTLTKLKTAIENDIPNITKVIIKGCN